MKKNVFKWLSIFIMTAVCAGFASCGDDDDDVDITLDELSDGFVVEGIKYKYDPNFSGGVIADGVGAREPILNVYIPYAVQFNGAKYIVTGIGNYGFGLCVSVQIPESVKYIENYAFSGSRLTSITIPGNVKEIGDGVFNGCSGLTSVTINNGVKSIGEVAFLDCSSLTSVTIPNSVTSMGMGAFCGCTNLTSINISENLEKINSETFGRCSKLKSVKIPNSVSRVGDGVFYDCSSLEFVYFGDGVKSIGQVFRNCNKLRDVYCYAKDVPSIALSSSSNMNNVTLHVPASSLNAYKAAYGWKEFGRIVGM